MSYSKTAPYRPAPRKELAIEIAPGPKCPRCREDGFDDWHHEPTVRVVGAVTLGRLKCHGCGRYFSFTRFHDGETHSTAWRKVA